MNAAAFNKEPSFAKFLFSYSLPPGSAFHGLSGTASIVSQGQGFSQALFSVNYIAAGAACPKNGEKYNSYEQIKSAYPTMKRLAALIVKQPYGSRQRSITSDLAFPVGVPISGCVVLILDGSVRQVGGPFKMISDLVLKIAPVKPSDDAIITSLDDEFCSASVLVVRLQPCGDQPTRLSFVSLTPRPHISYSGCTGTLRLASCKTAHNMGLRRLPGSLRAHISFVASARSHPEIMAHRTFLESSLKGHKLFIL